MPPPHPIANIITPIGMLGYGLSTSETALALATTMPNGAPTAIILDSGSTDSGPEKLALGCMSVSRENYKRDLRKLVKLGVKFGVPVIFSSAGGDGSDEHVREMVEVLRELGEEGVGGKSLLKIISLYSEPPKSLLQSRLSASSISPCGTPVPHLTPDDIATAPTIVAQMGPEPFHDAMTATPDFDVLVAGRAYDPAPYVAFCCLVSRTSFPDSSSSSSSSSTTPHVRALFGAFSHMGKIMECGGLCARPKGAGATAVVYSDASFEIRPNCLEAVCSPFSVSAHALYEKSRPDVLAGPGGVLDLTQSAYEQLRDGRTVKCRGAEFRFSREMGERYTVKIEGARLVGFRAVYMGCYHDSILINQLDDILTRIRGYVTAQHRDTEGTWKMDWHVYGKDTVTAKDGKPGEIFLVGEALAPTQELANSIVSTARVATVHVPYPGMKATAGAFAYGIGGKVEIPLGPCAEFAIYHLVDLEEGEERLKGVGSEKGLFWQEITMIRNGEVKNGEDGLLDEVEEEKAKKRTVPLPPDDDGDTSELPFPKTLGELAGVLRSKNAGPFEVTFDVMFKNEQEYRLVKEANFLNVAIVSELFKVKEEEIVWSGFFDQALAWKATIPRMFKGKMQGNGGFMENDVHGSQRYFELSDLALPEDLVRKLELLKENR